jgi:hypothetical protein
MKELADLKSQLIMHKHFAEKAVQAIRQLADRLRQRTPEDISSFPGDRAALLDADLVLAEAYKLTAMQEQA